MPATEMMSTNSHRCKSPVVRASRVSDAETVVGLHREAVFTDEPKKPINAVPGIETT